MVRIEVFDESHVGELAANHLLVSKGGHRTVIVDDCSLRRIRVHNLIVWSQRCEEGSEEGNVNAVDGSLSPLQFAFVTENEEGFGPLKSRRVKPLLEGGRSPRLGVDVMCAKRLDGKSGEGLIAATRIAFFVVGGEEVQALRVLGRDGCG
jgi:hypothetical protein